MANNSDFGFSKDTTGLGDINSKYKTLIDSLDQESRTTYKPDSNALLIQGLIPLLGAAIFGGRKGIAAAGDPLKDLYTRELDKAKREKELNVSLLGQKVRSTRQFLESEKNDLFRKASLTRDQSRIDENTRQFDVREAADSAQFNAAQGLRQQQLDLSKENAASNEQYRNEQSDLALRKQFSEEDPNSVKNEIALGRFQDTQNKTKATENYRASILAGKEQDRIEKKKLRVETDTRRARLDIAKESDNLRKQKIYEQARAIQTMTSMLDNPTHMEEKATRVFLAKALGHSGNLSRKEVTETLPGNLVQEAGYVYNWLFGETSGRMNDKQKQAIAVFLIKKRNDVVNSIRFKRESVRSRRSTYPGIDDKNFEKLVQAIGGSEELMTELPSSILALIPEDVRNRYVPIDEGRIINNTYYSARQLATAKANGYSVD